MNAYILDLRKLEEKYLEEDHSQAKAAKQFVVSSNSKQMDKAQKKREYSYKYIYENRRKSIGL